MHSSLAPHVHPNCVEIVKAFEQCHEEHKIGKFFGACNDLKYELAKCFRSDSVDRRANNFKEAQLKKERIREKRRLIDKLEAKSTQQAS